MWAQEASNGHRDIFVSETKTTHTETHAHVFIICKWRKYLISLKTDGLRYLLGLVITSPAPSREGQKILSAGTCTPFSGLRLADFGKGEVFPDAPIEAPRGTRLLPTWSQDRLCKQTPSLAQGCEARLGPHTLMKASQFTGHLEKVALIAQLI